MNMNPMSSSGTDKLIHPCPPTNQDCHCSEIHTPEGTYKLMQEFYQENLQPQFCSGTHVSFFCPTSTVTQQHPQQKRRQPAVAVDQYHTPNSSGSDLPASEEEEDSSSAENTVFHPCLSDPQLCIMASTADEHSKPAIQDPHSGGGSLSSLFSHHKSHHKKPKTSLTKLKSSFIEYVTTHRKVMHQERASIFFNVGLNFLWMDYEEMKDPLAKLSFGRAYPTCQDVNQASSSTKHLDVIIGFSSGDLVWYDTVCNRYSRINKNGIMNESSVTMVKWIPGSQDLFMASFQDGSMLILDKERDDQVFTIPARTEQFQITKPNRSRHNPVAHWQVSPQGITAFAFSPNHQFVATVGMDGLLRTIDYTNERLCDVHVGYYGRLLCVAWSPDGQYILTGGQDDLVSLWSFRENRIIARCQGHRSWVTGVAFDSLHCDKAYRFASVGEDCKLILWDFSVNALHRPRQPSQTMPTYTKRFKRPSLFAKDIITQHVQVPTIHPAPSKSQVPFLQPIVKQTIHPDPCVDVVFRQDAIITTDRRGRVRAWVLE